MNNDFQLDRQEEILNYWFGRLEINSTLRENYSDKWFSKKKEVDDDIRFRFELDLKRSLEGKLKVWEETARGSLALIILIDQFSRNMYRGSVKAFEGDNIALNVCLRGIEKGFDIGLHPIERMFFYMPLMHSEDLKVQMTSLECLTILENLCTSQPAIAPIISQAKMYAERHYLIIEKFGRFPHRNEIIGRESTQDETEFLKRPGSSF